jgi:hypothetical protein
LREEPDPRHQGTPGGIAVLENGQGKAEHLATNKPRLGAVREGAEHLPREQEELRDELQGPYPLWKLGAPIRVDGPDEGEGNTDAP